MEFLPKAIDDYAKAHSKPEIPLLYELYRETHLKEMAPAMLSGHQQGNLLRMISFMMQPTHILELGTYTGYSAICLAAGLKPGGQLISIDINEELRTIQEKYIEKAGLVEQITLMTGNALDLIPNINQTFDLVFIDADKVNYSNYFHLIIDKVRNNGIVVVDNVLWYGKVIEKDLPENDKDSRAIKAFNQMVHEDERVENLLLPFRDGLMFLRKLPA